MSTSTSLDFEIGRHRFRAERLTPREQFHLSRKLAPLVPPMVPMLMQIARNADQPADIPALAALAEPFALALSAMKNETADEIFDHALRSVKVETSPTVWMPLWTGGMTIVAELNDLSKLLPIVLRVIQFNLGDFISGILTSREGPAVAAASNGDGSPVARTG